MAILKTHDFQCAGYPQQDLGVLTHNLIFVLSTCRHYAILRVDNELAYVISEADGFFQFDAHRFFQ